MAGTYEKPSADFRASLAMGAAIFNKVTLALASLAALTFLILIVLIIFHSDTDF